MSRVLLSLLAAAVVGGLAAAPSRAAGFLVPTAGAPASEPESRLEASRLDVVVRGPQARVTLTQTFKNLTNSPLEADYVFPLPTRAIVSSVTLLENGKGLEGRLLRAEDARRAYEEIVRRRKDPALLQYLGNDFFRVRLFPLPPGASRTLSLVYERTLEADGGLVEFLHPLGATPSAGDPPPHLRVEVDLETRLPLGPIYSPTHELHVTRSAPNRARLVHEGVLSDVAPDLVLYWGTTTRRIGASLLTWWPAEEDRGYFLFLATPALDDESPRPALPKNITFVVDTSGSMAGEKIEQVRSALKQIIPALSPLDRFNVVAYHTSVVPLWPGPRAADDAARTEALDFVEAMRAAGGTHIEGALAAALASPRPAGMPSVLLFLTDGRPTLGETDPQRILAKVRAANEMGKMRVFVLGVGVDVNTVMLDRLALENRGAPAFVRPRENVEVKVARLYDKVRSPVLTDLRLAAEGMAISEALPAQLPDLFRGGEIVLAGRYREGGSVHLTLAGRTGTLEREYHSMLTAARRGNTASGDFPARVWATRRIAELLDAIRLHEREDPELVSEIVRLSTRFGILTEYTAFLADETGVSHSEVAVNARRARKNLQGLTRRAVGGAGLAQSANQALRRDALRAPPPTYYLATPGDRDVEQVTLSGVRQVASRTFYFRGPTLGWVDVNVPDSRQPDEVVTRWSPRFFEILRQTSPAENARLAQAGTLLLEVQGRVLRIVEGS